MSTKTGRTRARWRWLRAWAAGATLPALALVLTSCSSSESKLQLEPARALGTVLAEEAVRAAGAKKQVALILPHWGAESTAGETLKSALKKQGVSVLFSVTANMGDPMRRGPIGLKAADFFAALEKASGAGAVVSLAGAPLISASEAARFDAGHPPVLVAATSSLGNVMGVRGDPLQLASLLEARVIQVAIVDSASPGAQASGKTDETHRVFDQNYQLLRRPD